MKILITGSAGNLGGLLAGHLLNHPGLELKELKYKTLRDGLKTLG